MMQRPTSARGGRRARARQTGQALLEFSLVSMLFLGFLVGIIEGARMIGSYFALSNAASEAARVGAIVPSPTATGSVSDCTTLDATQSSYLSVASLDNKIRCRARTTMQPWISLPDSAITICRRATITSSCDAAGTSSVVSNSYYGGSVIDVTVTYNFQFLLFEGGFLHETSVPMTGYKRARID
jgi:Flp pilus assembly protein TadG